MIPEKTLSKIKCCVSNNSHVVDEPVILNCGSNACVNCIKESNNETILCLCCDKEYYRNELLEKPQNKNINNTIQFFLTDLLQDIHRSIYLIRENLNQENLCQEIDIKIGTVENEMDNRVESLISDIYKHRENCRLKLNNYKEEFKELLIKDDINEKFKMKKQDRVENSMDFFREKQNELRLLEKELQKYRDRITQLQFIPNSFSLNKELFGEISSGKDNNEKTTCWLSQNDSRILNLEESLSLIKMNKKFLNGFLLYRATRDGFSAKEFHSKCDNRENTVTIIKNNLNFVFGGYTAATWNSAVNFISDPKTFIFSLRRNGISYCDKYMIKSPEFAIRGQLTNGPVFGKNKNIFIKDGSDILGGNQAFLDSSFDCPKDIENSKTFLAGKADTWNTNEIEVYQLTN